MLGINGMQKQKIVVRKRKLGKYPWGMVVFSMTLSLLILALLAELLLHYNQLTSLLKSNIEVHVYFKKELTKSEVLKIQTKLASLPYIGKKNGKALISYTSEDRAAREFEKETGEDFIKYLGENPLKGSFTIRFDPEKIFPENMPALKTQISNIEDVDEVVYHEGLIDAIHANVAKISFILIGFALILLFVVFVLIHNTIKLALYSQRFLIRSMQLVGANSSFIRQPFVLRAIGMGFFSGIFASILLLGILFNLYINIDGLDLLKNYSNSLYVMASICTFGALIGWLSSLSTLNKYLKYSLDDLY